MKKKFGLFALVLTVLLCGSLFLFAACGDGEEEEPSATPAISVTVNETARQSGATIEGDTEDTYTIAASVVNGEEGASVTISYVYESGEAETFTGSTFSPREAGTYVFTFTAEGASNFTLTFEIAEAQAPVVPVITASADRNEITAGGQVTLTWSATENAQVTVTYTKDGESASALQPESGVAFTIAEAGKYVFTFAAEGAQSVDVTVTVTAAHTHVWATEWTIKPATATEEGKASRACIVPGCTDPVEVQEVTLPALNSDEAEDFYTVTVKTPATCTEKGVSTYAWVSNDDIAFDVTGGFSYEQSAHTDLAYVAAVAPTCTEAGTIAHAYCEDCGKYYNVTGDASDYTIGAEIADGAAGLTGDPATEHSYAVSFDTEEDYTTALGTADGQYTVDCANECGTETTIALPALTAENTWTKSEEVAATCMNPGTATFTATVSSVTVVVKGVQTAPATGHSYEVSYDGTSLSAVCEKGDSTVTATVTIGGGDGATGATAFGSDAFAFVDGTFTVTLPQNAFEKAGFRFSGWLVGSETKQAGDSATVAADGTLTITAQWTEVTKPTISAQADKAEIYAGEQVTLTWSLTGGEGEVTVTYTKDEVPADTLKPVSGEAFAINEVGVYKFTFTAVDAEAVTVTVTVKENVITLSVTLGGELVDGVENDGSATVCIGTEIGYIATVTGGGSVTGVYIFEDGNATDLTSAEGTFTFENIGTYRFTFSANGATSYVYTVEVVAHDYTGQPYISAGEEGHYQVCKNCGVAHSETVAHVLQAENNNTQHWQGCAVCDYETAKSDHVLTWQSDDTQHWQACSGCAYTTAKENHSYAIAYADGTVDYVCECGKVSASATVTITVTGGTGVVAAEAFSWTGEEFEIDLSQVEISELAADVKVVYYRIADELIVTDESYAFAESVAIEAVLEDTQATIGGTGVHWNETAWSSVLKKGDAMTVAGQLDSTAAFNWQGVFVQVYSTENVVGAFRLDNYINGEEGPEDNAAYSTGENFILTKDGTYTDFNEKGTFINLIKDCTLRITIDWTNPALIEITLNLTGKVDGVNKVQTVCYTIAAKPDTSLKDSYTIGLGYEEATYAISSVERCDGQHGDAELFCSVCNELNKTALDAAATETAAWDNGVTLGADAFVMKATITGNDAYGVFYELITQVDGDFVTAEAPKGYVDVHASNVQDTGTYFNAWGGGNNGFDSTADKMIVQHGTRPVGADAWSGGVYTIYAFRDTQGSGMLYVEYTKDGSTYGAGVYLQNWAANVSVRFTAVGVMTEGASVTVLTGAYPAA